VRALLGIAAAGIVALSAPALARAYGWPLAPFDQQHAIRGSFDDPRIHVDALGMETASFHFGVDICADGGTPVYAVAPGTVYRYPDAVAVRQRDGHEFSYWHITAAVAEHQAVREHDLLGWVKPEWGHVHFAESIGGTYVNPLRAGALQPYVDTTRPTVGTIAPVGDGLVVDVWDTPPIAPPAPWEGARLTPALVRWRVDDGPWQTAVDFRRTLLPPERFNDVYAVGTCQNKPNHPGRYLIWLTHDLDVRPGTHRIEVGAADLGGNVGLGSTEVTVQSRSSTNRSSAYTRGNRLARRFSSPRRSTSQRAP
jgi:hypothetical protein